MFLADSWKGKMDAKEVWEESKEKLVPTSHARAQGHEQDP
jgi:hypothetical protein